MKIGVDLDGCVYDFVGSFRRWLVSQGWAPEALPWPTRYDWWPEWGLTRQEWSRYFADGLEAGVIFGTGPPIKGALTTLHRLREAGHTLHIVTSRPQAAHAVTSAWLAYFRVPFDTLTFALDKTLVDVDVIIEDTPQVAEMFEAAGRRALVFDQAWNVDCVVGERCRGWGAVLAAVERIAGEPPETILDEASRIVGGDRGADYGHPALDFARTGRIWGGLLETWAADPSRPVPARLVALCMVGVKLSRHVNKPKRDNLVDVAGYARCAEMVDAFEG